MDFVAIDFETADEHPESACSVGLVRMNSKGEVLGTWYSLIKPPYFCRFARGNTAIHGLCARDVRDAHDFAYLWPDIRWFIGESVLVAHNARFDMGVLKSLLEYYKLEIPDTAYFCSLEVSRRVWPLLGSHALEALSERFGLKYNAHNALDDAGNCAKVFAKACGNRMSDLTDLRKFLITRGVQIRYLKDVRTGGGGPSYLRPY